jgi:hypothetical protein
MLRGLQGTELRRLIRFHISDVNLDDISYSKSRMKISSKNVLFLSKVLKSFSNPLCHCATVGSNLMFRFHKKDMLGESNVVKYA